MIFLTIRPHCTLMYVQSLYQLHYFIVQKTTQLFISIAASPDRFGSNVFFKGVRYTKCMRESGRACACACSFLFCISVLFDFSAGTTAICFRFHTTHEFSINTTKHLLLLYIQWELDFFDHFCIFLCPVTILLQYTSIECSILQPVFQYTSILKLAPTILVYYLLVYYPLVYYSPLVISILVYQAQIVVYQYTTPVYYYTTHQYTRY